MQLFTLRDTITAFDAYGNPYRRKIEVGIKKGEFVLLRLRNPECTGCVTLKAHPKILRLTNVQTGEPYDWNVPEGKNMYFPLLESEYVAACVKYPAAVAADE